MCIRRCTPFETMFVVPSREDLLCQYISPRRSCTTKYDTIILLFRVTFSVNLPSFSCSFSSVSVLDRLFAPARLVAARLASLLYFVARACCEKLFGSETYTVVKLLRNRTTQEPLRFCGCVVHLEMNHCLSRTVTG